MTTSCVLYAGMAHACVALIVWLKKQLVFAALVSRLASARKTVMRELVLGIALHTSLHRLCIAEMLDIGFPLRHPTNRESSVPRSRCCMKARKPVDIEVFVTRQHL